ncbi:MAG: Calcineurin-like phosphoesterase superfamily protein [Frankiales bacterium]|nr:Calcineurin-like phosphoesterase superfamily protein [Frankiales bacterium]
MEPAVLVHLSDIHFTGKTNAAAERNRGVRVELMRDLERMKARLGPATALVVTGDIAFSGDEAEYGRAKTWLDEVAALVGTANCQVLTVPGNHDVHWPLISPSARTARQGLRTCPVPDVTALVDTLLEDPGAPLLAPLANYNEFALGYRCEVAANGQPWQATIGLPRGYHLAVRGLTTVFNSDGDDTDGSLVVGRTQTVLPRDTPGAIYLLLAHHGPEDCRDRVEIRDRIKGKAWALLCGHRHDQRIQRVNDCLEIIAGAVHPEEDPPGWHPTYNWLTFDVRGDDHGHAVLLLDIYQRVLRPEWNEFRSGHGEGQAHHEELPLPLIPAPSAPSDVSVPHCPPPADPAALCTERIDVDEDASAGADSRPPLVDEEGNVDAERRLYRDLLDLAVPDQEQVLTDCGLLRVEDRTKDHVTMILDVMSRVHDEATRQLLAARIAAATLRGQERTT